MLLLLANRKLFYICNPITREYVELCRSVEYRCGSLYGFGASKITRQHKAVLIVGRDSRRKCEVNVYTLETGSWRCFKASAELHYDGSYRNRGAFANGNLHWIRRNSIVCFDLETECFSMFSVPPLDERVYKKMFCASKDHLRVCVVMRPKNKDLYVLVSEIWVMKEYGVEKSWTREHVIGIHQEFAMEVINDFYPVKVFKNGDILISAGYLGCTLFHYSNKNQTARKIGMLQPPCLTYLSSVLLSPSFLSLKRNLGLESVISF